MGCIKDNHKSQSEPAILKLCPSAHVNMGNVHLKFNMLHVYFPFLLQTHPQDGQTDRQTTAMCDAAS